MAIGLDEPEGCTAAAWTEGWSATKQFAHHLRVIASRTVRGPPHATRSAIQMRWQYVDGIYCTVSRWESMHTMCAARAGSRRDMLRVRSQAQAQSKDATANSHQQLAVERRQLLVEICRIPRQVREIALRSPVGLFSTIPGALRRIAALIAPFSRIARAVIIACRWLAAEQAAAASVRRCDSRRALCSCRAVSEASDLTCA